VSITLAIDTVSPQAIALAAVRGDAAARTSIIPTEMNHAALLIPAIEALLGSALAELSAIGVTSGPGSYAGLRVGIATAEAIAMARGVPVYGIPTLVAVDLAGRGSGAPDFLHATHPAGRGEAAIQPFAAGEPIGAPAILAPEDARGLAAIYGEGAAALGGHEVTPLERCLAVLALCLERFTAGQPAGVVPLYLREPSITRPRRTPFIPPASQGAA
jgi:tRNA threonylcarbamoyl adenosine modification protein YeaZ